LIEEKAWTEAQTAEGTGLNEAKVSQLLRGQLSGLSVDSLFAVLNKELSKAEVESLTYSRM
jgi:predicted XRE-type DNA-binding protein